jgi:hypothetical protein
MTLSTAGTSRIPSYGTQWPGSAAFPAPRTTWTRTHLSANQDGRAGDPVLQDGRTPCLCRSVRGSGCHPSPGPHTRISPGQHPAHHPTSTLPGPLCGEQEGAAGVANHGTGQGGCRGFFQAGQVWLTTILFPPSLRLTDFEVAAALQLRALAGE